MCLIRSILLLALFAASGFSVATTTTIDLSNPDVSYLGKVQATVNTVTQQDTVIVKSAKAHTLECIDTADWYYRTTDQSTDKIKVLANQVIDIPIPVGTTTFYVQRVSADGAISDWVTK